MSKQAPTIARLTESLHEGLTRLYGPRLRGVFVFGSYARGDQDRESDLDILIVVDAIQIYGAEIDRTSSLIAGLSLDYGISISRVFVSEDDWQRGRTAFLESVRQDAVPV